MEALGEASSHDFEKAGGDSFGGTELTPVRNRRAIVAVLLIDALTGLGGASQEDQQPAFVLALILGFNTLGANGKSVSALFVLGKC